VSSYHARLVLPGRNRLYVGVEADVSKERLTLISGGQKVATWPIDRLDVASHSDGFHIEVDGDEVILDVTDSARFAAALGVERSGPARHDRSGSTRAAARRKTGKADSLHMTAERTGAEQLEWMQRRVSDVALALTSDEYSPAEAFAEWLILLKEINRRHGQGSMPSDQFYLLNTRLLDLIPIPAPAPRPHMTWGF